VRPVTPETLKKVGITVLIAAALGLGVLFILATKKG
jgi:hypothetical protein